MTPPSTFEASSQRHAQSARAQRPTLPLSDEEARTKAGLLKALADPVRLRILYRLGHAEEPISVDELAKELPVRPVTIQYHIGLLRRVGLLEQRRLQGPWIAYVLHREQLRLAWAFLDGLA